MATTYELAELNYCYWLQQILIYMLNAQAKQLKIKYKYELYEYEVQTVQCTG